MKNNVTLAFGSNIGDSFKILSKAIILLLNHKDIYNLISSGCYRTAPVLDIFIEQDDYLNAACILQTSMSLCETWNLCQSIEVSLGKKHKDKNAPRSIDIDMIFFNEDNVSSEDLIIPHPRWHERLFVIQPLYDLNPFIKEFHRQDIDPIRYNLMKEASQTISFTKNLLPNSSENIKELVSKKFASYA